MTMRKLTGIATALAGLTAVGDVVVPNEPANVPEGKVCFGWNTRADGSGVWAEHRGICDWCGSTFRLWGGLYDYDGCCTNVFCQREGGGWSGECTVFHNVVATNFYPIFVDDKYEWSLESDGLTLTWVNDETARSLSVDTLGGMPVTAVGSDAFVSCTGLVSVTFSDAVKRIGECALTGTRLYESQVEALNDAAGFVTADGWLIEAYGAVTNLVIADGTRGVADGWFWNLDCDGLETISLPASLSGKAVLLPWAYRDGMQFVGWNAKADGTGDWATDHSDECVWVTVPEGGVTYYAKWVPDSWDFDVDENGVQLYWMGERGEYATTWNIPSSIGGRPVVTLGAYFGDWLLEDDTVLSVKIPDSVKTIWCGALEGVRAFEDLLARSGEQGVIYMDGWVVKTYGQIEALEIPEGTRGLVSGWFEDLDLECLSSVSLPASMAGKFVDFPDSYGLDREGKEFVGWNTKADGSGEWIWMEQIGMWCDCCDGWVEAAWHEGGCDCWYECVRCGQETWPEIIGSGIDVPEGGITLHAVYADEGVQVGWYDEATVVFDRKVVIPASMAGQTVYLPVYDNDWLDVPYAWGDVRMLGWCTSKDGKGNWLETRLHYNKSTDEEYRVGEIEVPEGGITLYAMLVPGEIECARVEGGIALYYWGEEIEGTTWNIPSEICGLPVVRLGCGVVNSSELTDITIPDSVRSIAYGAFADLTALQEALYEAHTDATDIVVLDGWVIDSWGDWTDIAPADIRGFAEAWYMWLNCEKLASVSAPASAAGSRVELPDGEFMCRDDMRFVGWNTHSDGSGTWAKSRYWCYECDGWVDAEWVDSACGDYLLCCATCGCEVEGDYPQPYFDVPAVGATYHAVFLEDDGIVYGLNDGVFVVFGKKTVLPASLAGNMVRLPAYGWPDGACDLPSAWEGERLVGWCTSQDGKGEWIPCYRFSDPYNWYDEYQTFGVAVPEGGITLYAMTVPDYIDCEKIEGGIALYDWSEELADDVKVWNVPSEICGQPVVKLGRMSWFSEGQAARGASLVDFTIPDTVKTLDGWFFGTVGTNDVENEDGRLASIDGWTTVRWGCFTNLVFESGTRGVGFDWWDDLDLSALRTITLPASMAGTEFDFPDACCEGKSFVGWNTQPDGGGEWARDMLICYDCMDWREASYRVEFCEDGGLCCATCGSFDVESFWPQHLRVTVPEGGATYYAIFEGGEDLWFEPVSGGCALAGLTLPVDVTDFAVPSARGSLPVVGICDWAFSGMSGLATVTIPDDVQWIGEGAFEGTALLEGQIEAAGEAPGLAYADGWLISAFGDWESIVLPADVRGVAYGWQYEVNMDTLRSIAFPASLAGQTVVLPDSVWSEYGEFVGWNTKADGTGDWVAPVLAWSACEDAQYDSYEIVIPEGGVTAHAVFAVEMYDEDTGLYWTECGATVTITDGLAVDSDDFRIPETVGGKRVTAVMPWALYDERENPDAPLALTVPVGVALERSEGESLFGSLNVWKVTFEGNGVSAREVAFGATYDPFADDYVVGWNTATDGSGDAATLFAWCYNCDQYRECEWVVYDECGELWYECLRCLHCAEHALCSDDCDVEWENGYFVVSVPAEGATYYRVAMRQPYFEYEAWCGGVMLTYCEGAAETLAIPAQLGGRDVVAIGENCFSECSRLLAVSIPDTVRFIGSYAFEGCDSLRQVTLPANLRQIGYDVFTSECLNPCELTFSGEGDSAESEGCKRICTGYLAFVDGGDYIFSGVETNLVWQYDGTSFGIEWQYGDRWHVQVAASECGSVAGDVDAWLPADADVSFAATPDSHCHFVGWTDLATGESVGVDRTLGFVLQGAVSLRADFAWDTNDVRFELGAYGSRDGGGELNQTVEWGKAAVAPTVVPVKGYAFDGWDKSFDSVTGALVVTAQWEQLKYAVDLDGIVGSDYVYGQEVTASTFANVTNGCTNVVCVGWVGTGDVPPAGTGHAVSFTVTQPSTLKWLYATNYWVSVSADEGGEAALTDADGKRLGRGLWTGDGTRLRAVALTGEGWEFVKWIDDETGLACGEAGMATLPLTVGSPRTVRATFARLVYDVTFDLGEFGTRVGGGELKQSVCHGDSATVPTFSVARGYAFLGWDKSFDSVTGALVVTAQWEKLWSDVVEEVVPVEAEEFVATTYDGYLFRETDGVVVGTVQVKAAKPKNDKKTGKTTTMLTVSVQLDKKLSAKGNYDLGASEEQTFAVKGRGELRLLLGSNGMTGSFEGYAIEGVPNVFALKDAESKAAAKAADAAYVGTYNLIAAEGSFTVTIAKKGKVKVTGTTAAGKKVSVSTQLLVGDDLACVPVMAPKADLAFTVWLGEEIEVEGLADAVIGEAGSLPAGSVFAFDAEALAALVGDATYAAYFPSGLAVAQVGKKWVVAPDEKGKAAKAGKVMLKKDKSGVDEAKLGLNPSALKLTYTAKTGVFKGTFKAYVNNKGIPKAVTVNVTGVMVGDKGYGTATVKKAGSIPVTVGL